MIVRLKGGLGNQMFQYAFVRCLEKKYNVNDIMIDKSFYKNANKVKVTQYGNSIDDFNVLYHEASNSDIKKVCYFSHDQKPMTLSYRIPMALEMILNKNKYFHVRDFKYIDPSNLLKYQYLDGSWQSWKYLDGIEDCISKEFTLRNGPRDVLEEQIRQVKTEESVFVGIRRGDYVINQANRTLYGSLSEKYYNNGIAYISERHPDAKFYIMSDDIQWVKSNLHFNHDVIFREGEMIGSAPEEIMFMSSCKHAIIPNSTFHWWGAWLIRNPDKIVIAPKEWFADGTGIDILPQTWKLFDR